MALINCPACGKRVSTLETTCPQCRQRISPPDPGLPAGAPPTPSPSVEAPDPDLPDPEEWIASWAKRCCGMLVAGFLLPVYVSGFLGSHLLWPWNLMSGMKAREILGTLLPFLLGVTVLVMVRMGGGVRRAVLFSAMAGGTWVLSGILGGSTGADSGILSIRDAGAVVVLVLMPLSACAVALGNRLRKRHPHLPFPRTLAAAGGIALVGCFLVPVGRGSPMIAGFFDGAAWKFAGPILLVLLALLAYGVLGAATLMRLPDPAAHGRLLSILARAILWGAPLTLLITYGMMMEGWGLLMAITFVIKTFFQWYGLLLLMAVGLASWLEDRLEHVRTPTRRAASRSG